MRLLEKDNLRLKKSVSALQKCNEDEESSLSSEEDQAQRKAQSISKMLWRCLRNIILRLSWP